MEENRIVAQLFPAARQPFAIQPFRWMNVVPRTDVAHAGTTATRNGLCHDTLRVWRDRRIHRQANVEAIILRQGRHRVRVMHPKSFAASWRITIGLPPRDELLRRV